MQKAKRAYNLIKSNTLASIIPEFEPKYQRLVTQKFSGEEEYSFDYSLHPSKSTFYDKYIATKIKANQMELRTFHNIIKNIRCYGNVIHIEHRIGSFIANWRRVFGAKVHIHIHIETRKQLEPNAKQISVCHRCTIVPYMSSYSIASTCKIQSESISVSHASKSGTSNAMRKYM